MVLVFGVFGLGSEPVVNEQYNAEQAKRKAEQIKADRADTLDELVIELAELGSARSTNLADSLSICRSRIDVSDEIIRRGPAGENMREKAVTEGLLARVKLYGLDFTNQLGLNESGPELRAAYEPYLDDSNPKIYSNARVAMLTHQSFEKIKSGGNDVAGLVELFADTMKRFPENEFVASMIEAHLSALIEKEPSYSEMLFTKLRDRHPKGTLKPVMERKLRNISDRLLLRAENFSQKYTDRWANGRVGRSELSATASRLLKKPDIGLLLLQRVLGLGQWFERNEFIDEAIAIYVEVIEATDRGKVIPELREQTKTVAKAGLFRISMQGKTIEYRGVDSAGKQLIDAEMKKKIGIVVFWSGNSEGSVRYLAQLNARTKTLRNKPITIYAVCVDPELPTEITLMMRKASMIRIMDRKFGSGVNSFLEVCPPGMLPHVMLVGFDGKIEDINADPTQVENKALTLLMNRLR